MNDTQKQTSGQIPCPECDTPLQLPSDSKMGQIVECKACGIENEVINIDPIEVSPLEEEK